MPVVLCRCLARYEDDDPRKPVVLLAKGSGGLAELHTYLNEHSIAYGLIRTVRARARVPRARGADTH